MLLAIDVGNTNIVVGIYQDPPGTFPPKRGQTPLAQKGSDPVLVESGRMSTGPVRTVDEYAITLGGLLERLQVPPGSVTRIVIVSVVPKATAGVKAALNTLCKPTPLVVGDDCPIPIRNRYRDPTQVGADRLVNAVAARRRYGAPVIIVDFGTAITVDVVSGQGAYLGGMIAPGLEIGLEALAAKAALLPRIDLAAPHEVVGRDTVTSMQSGVVHGYGALCDGLVTKIKAAVKIRKAPVVATGGHASFIAPYCRTVTDLNSTLTLDGLAIIAQRLRPRGSTQSR